MIGQKTVTVKGDAYILTHISATKGVRLLKQIVKLVGPAMATKEGTLTAALEKLFENLDSVDVEALVKELVNSASKGSVAINFDTEFAGEYDKLFLLVKEVAEFNFGSVFTLLGSGESVI